MQENMERKQKLESAIKEYLSQAKMHRVRDPWDLVKSGDHAYVFGMSTRIDGDDKESAYFLVPIEAELELMGKVEFLFESQVSPKTVRSSLQLATNIHYQDANFIFPFSTDEQEQLYHDKIYEQLNYHYQRQYDALVPLYQLECADGVEFPLANAILYSGGERSLLATIANNEKNLFQDADKKQIELCSYLKFRVTGDSHSRLEQAEYETERALQVLRFIYPWFENDGNPYNPSHAASMWKHANRVIVYDRIPPSNDSISPYVDRPNGIFGTRRISGEFLSDAKKFYGLGDINYHFQNHDLNLVSWRFCRAFKFYDIASQTSDADVALANFTICVDILLPKGKRRKQSKAEKLTSYLVSLIEKGGLYEGKMTLNEQLSNPDKTGWPERVRLTVSNYKDFYIIRNKVVHGNTMNSDVSVTQVNKSRQIAKNAIRAYAYLARAFNWQNDEEAKNWFENPRKPPEIKSP